MTKSIEKIPACNELNPVAMDSIGRLTTSEFVNGGMSPAKVSLRWSVHDCRRIYLDYRGPNFVSSLHLHPYFVYISNKVPCESAQACLGFRWSKMQHVPQNKCAGSNIAWTTRDICVQFSFI